MARQLNCRHHGFRSPGLIEALHLLHEFQTISERIVDEDSLVTFEGRVIDDCQSSFSTAFNDRLQVTDQQTRMRLGCGMKVFVDTEMDLHTIGFEPAATPLGEVRRFGRLKKAKHVSIEPSGMLLPTSRHRKLNMVDTDNWHLVSCRKLLMLPEHQLKAPPARYR